MNLLHWLIQEGHQVGPDLRIRGPLLLPGCEVLVAAVVLAVFGFGCLLSLAVFVFFFTNLQAYSPAAPPDFIFLLYFLLFIF